MMRRLKSSRRIVGRRFFFLGNQRDATCTRFIAAARYAVQLSGQ
jgi:hypothetical protein